MKIAFSMPNIKTWLNCASIYPCEHVLNIGICGLSADSSNENPYEDIELESQCSQQSLPSSPGADSTKVLALCGRHDILQWWRFLLKWFWNFLVFFFSTGFKAWILQTEFSQEFQAAGPAEIQPLEPRHQRWGCFVFTPAQPPLHPYRAWTHLLAARGSLQPHLPQDTNSVCLTAYFRAVYVFSYPLSKLFRPEGIVLQVFLYTEWELFM